MRGHPFSKPILAVWPRRLSRKFPSHRRWIVGRSGLVSMGMRGECSIRASFRRSSFVMIFRWKNDRRSCDCPWNSTLGRWNAVSVRAGHPGSHNRWDNRNDRTFDPSTNKQHITKRGAVRTAFSIRFFFDWPFPSPLLWFIGHLLLSLPYLTLLIARRQQ
jgi:hypothetical protein